MPVGDEVVAWLSQRLQRLRTRRPVAFGLAVFARDQAAAGSVVGSAIAFRLFLFFVPFVLFLVGCAGFVAALVDRRSLDQVGITGALADQIDRALGQSTTARWTTTILGLFGMATAGRTLSKAMTQASCLAWQIPPRARASARVIGTVVGLISGMGVIAVLVNTLRAHLGVGIASVSFIAAAALYCLAWLVVSVRLPRQVSDAGALLPGAALMGVTIATLQAVSQLYLPRRFSSASELYGALGVTIVALSWFFLFGRMVVVSMVLNAVVFERYGSVSTAVFGLPGFRRAAARWPWIRSTFHLDPAEPAPTDQEHADDSP